jgi:hypothetical protein
MAHIQALAAKETMSKAHMQVHTNRESHKNQPRRKPGPKWDEMGPSRSANPFRARFGAPFDLAVIQTIYSPLAKSHREIDSLSAAEEHRREGYHSEEERVEMVD